MVSILSELLGLPRHLISIERNFFELGASSALLSEFVVKSNGTAGQRAVRISDSYRHHTIRELAAALESESSASSADAHHCVSRAAARRQALLKHSSLSRQR